ncbi:peptidoglycan editing factor PgeF [Oxalicibacterium solurbis]|uniref:Purine nucleoside phosphorylase n=1 Tax=Oxalicibacterium solurbis TaxID=69280 RepID=A0A8J3ASV7_9BURK|nr:peptidoglycan editing factor PgeF [Oxalicibacterium solurbis]GGI53079.1 laccase domain protein [Oxalicibacterium solurbis]
MTPIVPDWSISSDIVGVLMTVRSGGVSSGPYGDVSGKCGLNLGLHVGDSPHNVMANRSLLLDHVPSEPAWLTQVHGTDVVDAARVANASQADASIATQRGTVCAIMTADCLPVLLADAYGRVVGAAHAGWRGLAGGVLEHTVERMRKAGGEELHAWLGPAIGPEQFEVGEDVLQAFTAKDATAIDAFRPIAGRSGKYLADIYRLARQILAAQGVMHVAGGDFCTVTDAERFYSYRRDGFTGRMAALIWLR